MTGQPAVGIPGNSRPAAGTAPQRAAAGSSTDGLPGRSPGTRNHGIGSPLARDCPAGNPAVTGTPHDNGPGAAPPTVLALGRARVKGTRWQWLDEAVLDAGGVHGDREWALVDDDLRCLRTVAHPGLMACDAPAGELDALVAGAPGGSGQNVPVRGAVDRGGADRDGRDRGRAARGGTARDHDAPCADPVVVTYWGRPVEADLFDPSWCAPPSPVARLVGRPVRLARARRRPGFLWHWPVSVLLASEVPGLVGGGDDVGVPQRTAGPHGSGEAKAPGPTGEATDPALLGGLARYRPNLVVDDRHAPLALVAGSVLRIGAVTLVCRERIERCAVVNHDPSDVERVTPVLRSLPDHRLGWGCEVLVHGNVSCGTPVEVIAGPSAEGVIPT